MNHQQERLGPRSVRALVQVQMQAVAVNLAVKVPGRRHLRRGHREKIAKDDGPRSRRSTGKLEGLDVPECLGELLLRLGSVNEASDQRGEQEDRGERG